MPLPPTHPIDCTPILVLESDTAWQAESRAAADDDPDHPLARYWSGATRYDLATVADHLDEGTGKAVRFRLRRVSRAEWTQLKEMQRLAPHHARIEAIKLGLVRIEGGPWDELDLEGPRTKDGRLTDADLDALDRHYRPYFGEIGAAVLLANADLRADEGKPSGS